MIFQWTLPQVLAQTKTQTSRLWQDNWQVSYTKASTGAYDLFDDILAPSKSSRVGLRRVYHVDQLLSVQPSRGSKGVAKIRVLELAKRDVRTFTTTDAKREGFSDYRHFIQVWTSMHHKQLYKKAMRETFDFYDAVGLQDAEKYTALVIRFELVTEQKASS